MPLVGAVRQFCHSSQCFHVSFIENVSGGFMENRLKLRIYDATGGKNAATRGDGKGQVTRAGGDERMELPSFQDYVACKRRSLSDAELIERAVAGDRLSFDALVVRHAPLVLGFLSTRLSNASVAEDLAQEVFLSAYSHLSALREPSRFVPWLLRISRNRLLDHWRGVSRRLETRALDDESGPGLDGYYDPAPDPSEVAANSQLRLAVLEEISRMKDRYRSVLLPRLVGEESTEEIAHRLGLKVDTVRMRLLRGMRKLRKALTRRGITLDGETAATDRGGSAL